MKKNIKFIFGLLTLCLVFTISSCYQTVYYDTINDVVSEKATVSGVINSITRYTVGNKEYLVVNSSSGIKYKLADNTKHGSWKKYSSIPFKLHSYDYYHSQEHVGEQILKVLSDETTLYLVTVTYKNNYTEGTSEPSSVKIWAKQITLDSDGESWSSDGEWVNIINDADNIYFKFYTYNTYIYSAFSVFGTNSVQKAHRQVFIRSGDVNGQKYKTVSYYKLNGTSAPVETEITVQDSTTSNACSAAYYNGNILFFNALAVATNETLSNDATRIYYGTTSNSKNLIYYNATEGETDFTSTSFDVGARIMSLAVCQDSLLIGKGNYTSTGSSALGGITKTSLVDGIPGSSLLPFSTNADVQLPTSYFIICLLNVTPDVAEEDTILYASTAFLGNANTTSASYNDIGLWSYYPSRGNWNRE